MRAKNAQIALPQFCLQNVLKIVDSATSPCSLSLAHPCKNSCPNVSRTMVKKKKQGVMLSQNICPCGHAQSKPITTSDSDFPERIWMWSMRIARLTKQHGPVWIHCSSFDNKVSDKRLFINNVRPFNRRCQ